MATKLRISFSYAVNYIPMLGKSIFKPQKKRPKSLFNELITSL